MTLDEAIIHCEDVANSKCDKCGEEHRQLAEWLKELKQTRQVIEDIKAEAFRQSEQNNENFSHDWNEGFNDGMFHTLTIIRECFKHISGKENE